MTTPLTSLADKACSKSAVNLLLHSVVIVALSACQQVTPNHQKTSHVNKMQEVMLADFNDGKIPTFISATNGKLTLSDTREQADTGKALDVHLLSKDNWSTSLDFVPETPWDWSQYKDFHIAFDVSNYGTESVQVDFIMNDKNGDAYTRVFVIPVGGASTVYAKMDGHDQNHPDGTAINEFNFISGLRSNPPTWESDDRQVYSLWGKKTLDLSGISGIKFVSLGSLTDRHFTIDNIRLRPNPEMNKDFLVDIVDEFGQFTRAQYPSKIKSTEQLRALAEQEIESLKGKPLAGRSTYHGWANGPKLKATGYFRTEKVDGKWWLVDPQGYLYFSSGVDIIRLSNSSTITGYDFDTSKIAARDVNDIISEDDQPLNRVNDSALASRHLVNDTRAKMFSWLPEYDSELGEHYGYRRSVQSGPMKHGETYSFYSANLERRYGQSYEKSYMDTWRNVSIKRMID